MALFGACRSRPESAGIWHPPGRAGLCIVPASTNPQRITFRTMLCRATLAVHRSGAPLHATKQAAGVSSAGRSTSIRLRATPPMVRRSGASQREATQKAGAPGSLRSRFRSRSRSRSRRSDRISGSHQRQRSATATNGSGSIPPTSAVTPISRGLGAWLSFRATKRCLAPLPSRFHMSGTAPWGSVPSKGVDRKF